MKEAFFFVSNVLNSMKKAYFFVVIFSVVMAIAAYIYWTRLNFNESPSLISYEMEGIPQALQVGQPAPDIALKDLEGKVTQLKDYRGKVVLINFWATWCPPCLTEMPSLVSAYQKLKKEGLEILAINLDENQKPVHKFVDRLRPPFKIFLDPGGNSAQAYLVYGLPYTVILDRQGNIRHKIFGGHSWDNGKPFEKIKSLL